MALVSNVRTDCLYYLQESMETTADHASQTLCSQTLCSQTLCSQTLCSQTLCTQTLCTQSLCSNLAPLPKATRTIHRIFTVSRGLLRKPPQSQRSSRNPSPGRPLRSTVFSRSLEAPGANRRRVSEGPKGTHNFSTAELHSLRSGMACRT